MSDKDPVLGKIARIQRTARRWALLRGHLTMLLVAVCLVFGGVLLDHLATLQMAGRSVFLGVFVVACVAGWVAAALAPLLSRLSPLYVAGRIESTAPELKQCLITYLQCRADNRVPGEVKGLLRRRAYPHVRAVDARLLAKPARTERVGWAVIAVLAVFGLYAVASPKSVSVSIRRLFAPAASILPPTRTGITAVKPGDVWLLRGQGFAVRVETRGVAPRHAFVVWDGSSFAGRRVLLTRKEDGSWAGQLAGVLEDGSYYVVAGDTRSERYRVTALPPPAVTAVVARLEPPSYTGLPGRTVQDGNLETPSDTKVTLSAAVNLPAASGYLDMAAGERVWMDASAQRRQLTAEFAPVRSDAYRIVFETMPYPDGSVFRNLSPVTYTITCTADQAPVVGLDGSPEPVRLAPDAIVRAAYRARDDYGLVKLAMRHSINSVPARGVELPLGADGRSASGVHEHDLGALELRAGDMLEYWVEATDNWPRGPHVAESERRRILIGSEQPVAELPEEEDARPASDGGPPQESPDARDEAGDADATAEAGDADATAETGEQRQDAGPDRRERAHEVAEAARRALEQGEDDEADRDAGESAGRSECPAGEAGEAGSGSTGQEQGDRAAETARDTGESGGPESPGGGAGGASATGSGAGGASASGSGAGGASASGSGAAGAGGPSRAAGGSGAGSEADGGAGSSPGAGSLGGGGGAFRPGELLSPAEIEEVLRELQKRIEADEVPPQLLEDLGMNRKQLQEFIDRYLNDAEQRGADSVGPDAGAQGEGAARVLEAGEAAPDLTVESAAPAQAQKDDLRSRVEDASGRISARYRDAVNAYYKKLSEEQ